MKSLRRKDEASEREREVKSLRRKDEVFERERWSL